MTSLGYDVTATIQLNVEGSALADFTDDLQRAQSNHLDLRGDR